MNGYVGPAPENTCEPGQGQTFTEELGRHCVDLIVQHAPTNLATTGTDPNMLVGGIITAALLILGAGILFTYNHMKHKDESND